MMQSINRFLYGPSPEERVRAWQAKLRAESRQLEREMRQVCHFYLRLRAHLHLLSVFQLDVATSKARQSVKQLAAKGDVKSARILAKEVVRSNKQKDRLSVSKARLGSIGHQLQQQLGQFCNDVLFVSDGRVAMVKVTGTLQKSTEIMKLSNALIKLPQITHAMREMSMEMTKVGMYALNTCNAHVFGRLASWKKCWRIH
jgi:charged multivesicular body protein 3